MHNVGQHSLALHNGAKYNAEHILSTSLVYIAVKPSKMSLGTGEENREQGSSDPSMQVAQESTEQEVSSF